MTDRITPKELASMNAAFPNTAHIPRLIREVSQLNIELIRAREEAARHADERDGLAEVNKRANLDIERLMTEVKDLRAQVEWMPFERQILERSIAIEKDNEKLRAALREIVQLGDAYSNGNSLIDPQYCSRIARTALGDAP